MGTFRSLNRYKDKYFITEVDESDSSKLLNFQKINSKKAQLMFPETFSKLSGNITSANITYQKSKRLCDYLKNTCAKYGSSHYINQIMKCIQRGVGIDLNVRKLIRYTVFCHKLDKAIRQIDNSYISINERSNDDSITATITLIKDRYRKYEHASKIILDPISNFADIENMIKRINPLLKDITIDDLLRNTLKQIDNTEVIMQLNDKNIKSTTNMNAVNEVKAMLLSKLEDIQSQLDVTNKYVEIIDAKISSEIMQTKNVFKVAINLKSLTCGLREAFERSKESVNALSNIGDSYDLLQMLMVLSVSLYRINTCLYDNVHSENLMTEISNISKTISEECVFINESFKSIG